MSQTKAETDERTRPTAWFSGAALEVVVAVAAYAGLCVAVLARPTRMIEPDDFAYRASIVALTRGHVTLTAAQYYELWDQIGGIAQWVELSNLRWISEKNPGYPFFAAPFQEIGALRLAPLFYGGLACVGLFFGGRKWLGRWGGTWAVVLYCCSGAALVFAWRATMPTFTDASLIAAGTGGLLWAMLAADTTRRRRTLVGLLAFLALEGAVFIRYTNVVALVVAAAAVLLTARAARVSRRSVVWWLGSVAVFTGLVAVFDAVVYGSVTKTGYAGGSAEITFGLDALIPNLERMPPHLVRSMPLLVLALVALGWIAARAIRSGRTGGDAASRSRDRRDAVVAAALAATWLAVYGLYAAYTWTTYWPSSSESALPVIRFYVPALGAAALLAAWLMQQFPRWVPVVALAAVVGLGAVSYSHLAGFYLPGFPPADMAAPRNGPPPGASLLGGLPSAVRAPSAPGAIRRS